MTCIVGLAHEGKIIMGGDSAAIERWNLTVRSDPKVFRNGQFLIGFTSSFRMGNLLAYSFSPPTRKMEQDVYAFMVTDFIDAVRNCLKTGGYAERHNDAEKAGTFLVGYEGRLFKVDNDYHVGESADGYDACGCGEQAALGAMFANVASEPKARVLNALQAAERFSAGVRGPFVTVEM